MISITQDVTEEDVVRFYHNSKLILEIKNCFTVYNIGETINIEGNEYEIREIIHYPVHNYIDHLIKLINFDD